MPNAPNVGSAGSTPPREDEARLSGARAEFVGSLPRRLDALRAALRAAEEVPSDPERSNGLLRRVHAVGAASRVLGFASVAEALGEAEKAVRKALVAGRTAPFEDVARALDLLPSLVLGAPVSLRGPESRDRAPLGAWPVSVLVFGAPVLADALAGEDDGTRIELERTEDPARARELARIVGPDVVVVDADRPGVRELVADLVGDPLIEPVPVVVVGTFDQPEAAGGFVELGAARVLLKPCSPDTLRRTVQELHDRASRPRPTRDPLGDVTVPALVERIAGEFRRGLVDALEGSSQAAQVSLGEGHDVLAAVWGAVARVRELVTLHSSGGLRFQPTGPEGAVPLAPWSAEERRAGERGRRESRSVEGVSLEGRRVLVADDDPAVVWFMAGLLKAVGVEVIEAHDGKQALELAFSTFPDTVISDVLMPKLDGFSLCHEIKRDVAVRDAPVILLSWKEDLLQRLRELGADADGYLRKEAAASAVVERVREVLHSRARIEERMRTGGEVRGRLDGLTPRLVLELACRGQSDLRISIRDAAFLYEAQVRSGRLRSITRSAPDGSFVRGENVLPSLLGVSAGRFVVDPDSSPCRSEFTGELAQVLAGPIARARSALAAVAEKSLVRLEKLELDHELVRAYLECTPEPAATLTRRLLAGESVRDLVLSGEVAPRLLEAVLSDAARRGGVLQAALLPSASIPPRRSEPPAASVAHVESRELFHYEPPREPFAPVHTPSPAPAAAPEPFVAPEPFATSESYDAPEPFAPAESFDAPEPFAAPEAASASPAEEYEPEPDSDARPSIPYGAFAVNNADAGWFSLAVEPSAEPPPVEAAAPALEPSIAESAPFTPSEPPLRVVGAEPRMPLSDKATPGNWAVGPLFAFGGEHGTLPGVGELPAVAELPTAEPEAAGVVEAPLPRFPSEAPAPRPLGESSDAVGQGDALADPPDAAPTATVEETPDLELGTSVLSDGDDEPVPPPSPEPLPIVNERNAPTVPPSRVAAKLAQAPKPAPPARDGTEKGSLGGLLVRIVVAGVVAFFATTWLVPFLFGDPEHAAPAPAPTAAEPPPAAPAPAPAPVAAGLALRSEAMATPPGVALDPNQALVEVELAEAGSIKVDGSFVGRAAKRRLLLAPGRHRVEIEGEKASGALDLDLVGGRSVRLASAGGPSPAASAAPSAE